MNPTYFPTEAPPDPEPPKPKPEPEPEPKPEILRAVLMFLMAFASCYITLRLAQR